MEKSLKYPNIVCMIKEAKTDREIDTILQACAITAIKQYTSAKYGPIWLRDTHPMLAWNHDIDKEAIQNEVQKIESDEE